MSLYVYVCVLHICTYNNNCIVNESKTKAKSTTTTTAEAAAAETTEKLTMLYMLVKWH